MGLEKTEVKPKAKATRFKLKCVQCQSIEWRDANECTSEKLQGDQPFSACCFMPMTLEGVEYKQ